MKNKKGLSAIVATLMIILLTIVAIAIVFTVITNFTKRSASTIELSAKCSEVDLQVTQVVTTGSGTTISPHVYAVTFERGAGGDFALDGFKLVLENKAKTRNNISIYGGAADKLQPLAKQTYTLTPVPAITTTTDLLGQVTISAWFLTDKGTKYDCTNGQSYVLP